MYFEDERGGEKEGINRKPGQEHGAGYNSRQGIRTRYDSKANHLTVMLQITQAPIVYVVMLWLMVHLKSQAYGSSMYGLFGIS